MIYRNIKGTDLNASCICLGTADFGGNVGKEESFRLLDAFSDMGGNFIDTAHVYGNWIPGERSTSEKMLGMWLKERKVRGKLIIATKGAHPELSSMHIPRMSPAEIQTDLNESLEYLGVDSIDLYWLHRDDPNRPVGEILETLNEQVRKGKIRYFGCSNWKTSRLKEAMEYASKHGLKGFAARQNQWSLAKVNPGVIKDPTVRQMDEEAVEYHKQTGLAAVPYTSQARGYFTRMARGEEAKIKDWVKATYCNAENDLRLERVKRVAKDGCIRYGSCSCVSYQSVLSYFSYCGPSEFGAA
jgi:aryl-alcohol dehydrogenase-like predicted oxidoreductase